jgi:peptidoglycan/xylan/chitin deacetylase (PgdA/CDA1 family)
MRKGAIWLSSVLVVFSLITFCRIEAPARHFPDTGIDDKRIAVTIDDLPLNGPDIGLERLRAMTEKLLAAIKKNNVPVVGFVNESLLYVPGETDARIAVLRAWPQTGVELGNHTFSHLGFNNASLVQYEDDFIRGETVTKMLMKERGQGVRYFRHPFLQMGPTRELEMSFEKFISDRGYKIAPVTIDSMDWMFLAAFAEAKKQNDGAMLTRISNDYLKFADARFESCERASAGLFGHPIKQILLLHANELNAGNLDALFAVIKKRGYEFVTLEEALQDPVYTIPETYNGTSDWISLWTSAKNKKFDWPSPPEYIQKAYSDAQKRPNQAGTSSK